MKPNTITTTIKSTTCTRYVSVESHGIRTDVERLIQFLHSTGRSRLVQRLQRPSWTWTRAWTTACPQHSLWSDLHQSAEGTSCRIHSQSAESTSTLSNQLGALRSRSRLRVSIHAKHANRNGACLTFGLLCVYRYIGDVHRNIHVNSFKPKLDDSDTINSWGLSDAQPKPQENDINGYADSHIRWMEMLTRFVIWKFTSCLFRFPVQVHIQLQR